MKLIQLLSLLPRRPGEFFERTSAIMSVRWDSCFCRCTEYRPAGLAQGLDALLEKLDADEANWLTEPGLATLEARLRTAERSLPANAPFGQFHNGDTLLGRMCYWVARALKPGAVVETGVCYGVTSAYLLYALEVNAKGTLHSIDLPPLGKHADDYVGKLIPPELRSRWTLHRGSSCRLLPPLLSSIGQLDLFVHDSLHTYRNMRAEFDDAWPSLRPGGALISDDIEGNSAFRELSARPDVAYSSVFKEQGKHSLLGIAVKRA